MFAATTEVIESNRVTKYRISSHGRVLTFEDAIQFWQSDPEFRMFFAELLAESPFDAFRWETPALSLDSLDQKFQFVLLSSPSFATRPQNGRPFEKKFVSSETDFGVVDFSNLSGDATMVVPSPRIEGQVYGHLAAFLRGAPKEQIDALWKVVGRVVREKTNRKPLWLNTAGGGVAWLHVRLDSTPKYYGFKPFKAAS